MTGKLEGLLKHLHNKAFGGKGGFELDELYPQIESEFIELQTKLDKAIECIEFYSCKDNWQLGDNPMRRFTDMWLTDREEFNLNDGLRIFGGKRARKTLEEIKQS